MLARISSHIYHLENDTKGPTKCTVITKLQHTPTFVPSARMLTWWLGELPGAVWADVQLTWANCRAFNAPASPICRLCAESEAAVLRKWAAASLPVPTGVPPGATASASAQETGGPSLPKAKRKKKQHEAGDGEPMMCLDRDE